MCTAEGFGDNGVDKLELEQVFTCKFEGFGRFWCAGAVSPEDGGAAFGGDDRVIGEFEHGEAVADTYAECASGASFSDTDADYGYFEP